MADDKIEAGAKAAWQAQQVEVPTMSYLRLRALEHARYGRNRSMLEYGAAAGGLAVTAWLIIANDSMLLRAGLTLLGAGAVYWLHRWRGQRLTWSESARASADELGKRVAPFCKHSAALAITRIGIVVRERAVAREEIGVVVTVVRAGIDAVRIAINEPGDLLVIECGQRGALRVRDGREIAAPHKIRERAEREDERGKWLPIRHDGSFGGRCASILDKVPAAL